MSHSALHVAPAGSFSHAQGVDDDVLAMGSLEFGYMIGSMAPYAATLQTAEEIGVSINDRTLVQTDPSTYSMWAANPAQTQQWYRNLWMPAHTSLPSSQMSNGYTVRSVELSDAPLELQNTSLPIDDHFPDTYGGSLSVMSGDGYAGTAFPTRSIDEHRVVGYDVTDLDSKLFGFEQPHVEEKDLALRWASQDPLVQGVSEAAYVVAGKYPRMIAGPGGMYNYSSPAWL
jgi:hypothetical protein